MRQAQLARGCSSDGGVGCICGPSYDPFAPGLPDVVSKGPSLWVRGMDLRAVHDAVRFLAAQPGVGGVIDPFCGVGTSLAAANAYGLAAIGVDNSPPRCRKARAQVLSKRDMEEEKGERPKKGKGQTIKGWRKGHEEPAAALGAKQAGKEDPGRFGRTDAHK